MSGVGAAWLYWWEVQNLMLLYVDGPPRGAWIFGIIHEGYGLSFWLCIFHILFFAFLLAATLTDFYEMIIPDTTTVVGTLTALLGAVWLSTSSLPVVLFDGNRPHGWTYLNVWSPNPHIFPLGIFFLLIMTLLWWFWCFAMLDRVWYTKLPIFKANAIFWRYLYCSPRTKYIIAAAVIAPVCFAFVPDRSHIALFSALVGMAFGMVLVWGIRLVARWVLGIEAMGFGDVTLMGMIGAFLGWQAVLLIFFAAPFFGLV